MNKEFIPYEQALELKQLGFDEPCFAYYDMAQEFNFPGCAMHNRNFINLKATMTPLYQQAFRWFREKHDLYHNVWNYTHGEPTDLIPNGFTYSIDEDWTTIIGKKEDGYFEKYYNTYEEAELACLKKMIEIVKSNTDTP